MTQEEYNAFKLQFIEISISEFNACKDFISDINSTNNLVDLKQKLQFRREEIFSKLNGDINEWEEEISDLESELHHLSCVIDELKQELDEVTFKSSTIHDEMRYKTFLQYHSKYNPWEFEELLKNGKIG